MKTRLQHLSQNN